MAFLKLVHTESQVNHKTQPFGVKGVWLVTNGHTLLTGFVSGALCLATIATLKLDAVHKTKPCFQHWVFNFLPTLAQKKH